MKKYLSGFVAIMIAISAVALPKLNNTTSYFWYKRTGVNTYVANGQGTNPLTPCSGSAVICAKGFLQSQTPASITDATPADAQQMKN